MLRLRLRPIPGKVQQEEIVTFNNLRRKSCQGCRIRRIWYLCPDLVPHQALEYNLLLQWRLAWKWWLRLNIYVFCLHFNKYSTYIAQISFTSDTCQNWTEYGHWQWAHLAEGWVFLKSRYTCRKIFRTGVKLIKPLQSYQSCYQQRFLLRQISLEMDIVI